MSLLGQYIPEPPAIVELLLANVQEAIAKDQQQSRLRSKGEHERYVDNVVNGLARLCAEARGDNGADFERAIHELTLMVKNRARHAEVLKQALKDAKKSLSQGMNKLARKKFPKPAVIGEMRRTVAYVEWLISNGQRLTTAFHDSLRILKTLRDIRLAAYATEWENYLSKLDGTTSAADDVRKIWSHFKPRLWAPEASPSDDGDFIMVWDRGPHHLQVRILSSGLYDWFYRNRETNEVLFEEDLVLDGQYSSLDAIVSRIA